LDTKLETDVEHLFANLRSNINNFENPTRQKACKRRSDCSERVLVENEEKMEHESTQSSTLDLRAARKITMLMELKHQRKSCWQALK
jgi:hypothetical protein